MITILDKNQLEYYTFTMTENKTVLAIANDLEETCIIQRVRSFSSDKHWTSLHIYCDFYRTSSIISGISSEPTFICFVFFCLDSPPWSCEPLTLVGVLSVEGSKKRLKIATSPCGYGC